MVLLLCLAVGGCARQTPEAIFSPDGNSIIFTWPDRGLHQINVDGTGYRHLATGKWISDTSWSPDGKWLVYTRPVDPDGDSVERTTALLDLSDYKDAATFPTLYPPFAWSEDGSQLAGVSFREDRWNGLQVVSIPDGRVLRRAEMRKDQMTPTSEIIKLDGIEDVAFVALTKAANLNLYRVTGDRVVRLTNTGDVFAAAYDAKNHRIVYSRQNAQLTGPPALWSLNLRDQSATKLPFQWKFGENTPKGQERPGLMSFSFTPGADQIVFQGGTRRWHGLYMCELDGTGIKPIRVNRGKAYAEEGIASIEWDGAGERFVAVSEGKKPVLRVYSRDGKNGKSLNIPDPPREIGEPGQVSVRHPFTLKASP